ncbi:MULTISPECIES: diguanylate cyclase [unclassified Bradyrhizobium]|uniref:diguanylate cyclase n=1 Tax=unclassified Bradyrhizobium TaxID=2631580 RepID=UPI0028EE2A84|nr:MULTISPECIES: diguanylate cyclase [unclassified Bradyrhizobium]
MDGRVVPQAGRSATLGRHLIRRLSTRSSSASMRAEELRARVEALNISYGVGMLPRGTISVGVAAYPEADLDLTEILRVADGALYRAKHKGRNRVELASGGMVPPLDEVTTRAVAALDAIVARAETGTITPSDRDTDQQVA